MKKGIFYPIDIGVYLHNIPSYKYLIWSSNICLFQGPANNDWFRSNNCPLYRLSTGDSHCWWFNYGWAKETCVQIGVSGITVIRCKGIDDYKILMSRYGRYLVYEHSLFFNYNFYLLRFVTSSLNVIDGRQKAHHKLIKVETNASTCLKVGQGIPTKIISKLLLSTQMSKFMLCKP